MSRTIPRNAEDYRAWWGENTDVPYGYCWCGCGQQTNLSKWTKFRPGDNTVKGEPAKYLRGHHRRLPYDRYRKEDRGYSTPCWIWQGATTADSKRPGYGKIFINGGLCYAHRYFYERYKGTISEGLTIDHLCQQTHCVNPAHLEAVTHKENMRRYGARRRIYSSVA